jgi:ribonuclease P protein component
VSLSAQHRLKRPRDFQEVYDQGNRYQSSHFVLRALATAPEQPLQIGIVISRNVSKKAVVRNRLKRQIQGVMRELLPSLLPGWRVIIILRPRVVECNYEHFLRELKQLFSKTEMSDGH